MSELPPPVLSGITTNQNYSVEQLVSNIFLKGECNNVSNIEAIGNDLSVGYFEGGTTVFGFTEGVILTSGDIALAEGPNESVETGEQFGDTTNDPDINVLATSSIFDVAGIEFDFVPIGETVTFRYVFASEEYCEFVGSVFNDVFGFFVSGPGINGPFANNAINVAVLPGTSDYVSINNVNHNDNASSYVNNTLQMDANQCGIAYTPNFQDLIEYDGMTVPLKATIDVIPCETYHIRLVVADVGDDKLDSGVFLESQSFDIGGDVTVRAEVPDNNQPLAVEDCKDGRFVFTRNATNLSTPLTVDFTIDAGSTAEDGVDFLPIPSSITIPSGESSAALPISVLADGIAEDQEFLVLNLELPCDCGDPIGDTLFISDGTSIELGHIEIDVCPGQEFTMGPTIISGAAPFTFLWEDGSTENTITSSVTETTHFAVTVTDDCGSVGLITVAAIIQPVPTAHLMGNISLCDDNAFLQVDFEGNPPWSFSYEIDGTPQQTISNLTETPYFLAPIQSGIYTLRTFSDAWCDGLVEGESTVTDGAVSIDFSIRRPACFDSEDGSINIDLLGGTPPYSILWSPSVNDDRSPTNLAAGIYTVEVSDADDCTTYAEIILDPQGTECLKYKMYVPNAISPNNDGFNDAFRFYPASNSNIAQVQSLHIFNRWGDLILVKNNFPPDNQVPLWDGTFNGKILDAGVFVWQAVLELNDGTEELIKGEVMVVR